MKLFKTDNLKKSMWKLLRKRQSLSAWKIRIILWTLYTFAGIEYLKYLKGK